MDILTKIMSESGIDLNVNFDKLVSPELSALFFYLVVFIITLIVYYQLYILEFVVTRIHSVVKMSKRECKYTSTPEETI
jgi:hypothetical protein